MNEGPVRAVVVGVLVAVLGAGAVTVSLVGLGGPAEPAALRGVLAATIALGVLLVLAGVSTAVAAVRARRRGRE